MQHLFRSVVLAALAAAFAVPAAAGELLVKIGDGRATVIARDVPLRQILAEWARVGNTKMVNAEKLAGGPITIELVDVPEKDALDILLRSAAGYLTGIRRDASGPSLYDRVMILATSRPPATTAAASPAPFMNNRMGMGVQMPPQPPPEDDDDGEPEDQGPIPPPGANADGPYGPYGPNGPQGPQGPNSPYGPSSPYGPYGPDGPPNSPPQAMPFPGAPPGASAPPGAVDPNAGPTQTPMVAPRPGMLPQPQPGGIGRPPGAPPPGGGQGPDDQQ